MGATLFAGSCLLSACLVVPLVNVRLSHCMAPSQAPEVPPLSNVIERVGRYVEDYGNRMSVVVAVEHYEQKQREGDRSGISRSLVSEIALIRVKGDWLGYRDAFEVDGKKVSDRSDRLQKLFVESPQIAIEQGRRIADESARYNVGGMIRNFNVPTTALFFMQPSNLPRFRFSKEASVITAGVQRWKIAYEETRHPTIIRTSTGKDMPVKGYVWVKLDDGAILETEMRLESRRVTFRPDSAISEETKPGGSPGQQVVGGVQGQFVQTPSTLRIAVTYQMDARLNLLLPSEMREWYNGVSFDLAPNRRAADVATAVECRAIYSDYKRFETAGRIVPPK